MTLTDEQRSQLLDDDGENLAVRMFLMMYGGQTCTTQGMRRHLELAGFPYWPEWANADFHLTKGGAQLWIRYLIGLESAQPESRVELAKRIHYPDCWDTAAYPDLDSALIEVVAGFSCTECAQPESKPATLSEERELAQRFMQEADEGEDSIEELLKQCVSFCRAHFQQQGEPVACMWPTDVEGVSAFAFTALAIEEGMKQPDAKLLYTSPPTQPGMVMVPEEDGFDVVYVKGLQPLVDALGRAARKGYLPDAMAEEWDYFDFKPAAPREDR